MIRRTGRMGVLALVGVFSGSLITALTATSSVPGTRAGHNLISIGANDLKPSNCAGITLTAVANGNGTAASELVLGSSAGDTMDGAGGDDCILGGGGIDSITGNSGTDVCIGGPGVDLFFTCETQIQ
jgi:Ca2+-binding RTX toxin-like protein